MTNLVKPIARVWHGSMMMYLKKRTQKKRMRVAASMAIVLVAIISTSLSAWLAKDAGSTQKPYFEAKMVTATSESVDTYESQGLPIPRSREDDPARLFLLEKEISADSPIITRVTYRVVDGQKNRVKIAELRCGLKKYREIALSNDGGNTMKEHITDWIWLLIYGTREWDVMDFSCNHTAPVV